MEENRDAITQCFRLLDQIGTWENGLPAVANRANEFPDEAASVRVKSSSQFVKEEDAWIMHEGEYEKEALLWPAA